MKNSYDWFCFNCLHKQFVNEWNIPFEHTTEVLNELKILLSNFYVHPSIEVRFSKPDNIMLSPSYNRDSCWIGTLMFRPYNISPGWVYQYFEEYEKIMKKYNGRPHWAKWFTMNTQELTESYPEFRNFQKIRRQLDPNNLFANEWVLRVMES